MVAMHNHALEITTSKIQLSCVHTATMVTLHSHRIEGTA